MSEGKKKVRGFVPYLIAIAVFAALSAVCFAPQFEGKTLKMHDVTQYEGMKKDITDHVETYGEDPQWTGNLFGGMPGTLIWMQYDSLIIKRASKVFEFMGFPANYIFIAMVAFFVMLLMFRVDPWAAIVPAIAYGLSTYFFLIIGAGHITKMVASAYAPLMVGGVYYTLRRNMWVGAALTALFTAIEIGANHPQITYYFAFVLAALWINEGVRAWKEKLMPRFAKATCLLLVAGAMGVGANFAPLWLTNDYGKDSMRGGTELTVKADEPAGHMSAEKGKGLDLQYATRWSYGKMESFNMFIPDLMGGSSFEGFSDDGAVAQSLAKYGARDLAGQLPAYWGEQPGTAGPTYLGASVLFLCVLGLFLLRGRNKWWVAAVTVLAVMLAWGHNMMWFTELFFNYFPGYNKFRTVTMILVIAQWSVPFLAAIILGKLWNGKIEKPRLMQAVKRSIYVTGGVAMFFLLFGGLIFDFAATTDAMIQQQGIPQDVIDAMHSERASMMRADAFRSLIFVLLTAAVVLLAGMRKIRRGTMVALLAVVVCIDMVAVDMRYLPWSRFVEARQTAITPTAVDKEIMADRELGFRVFNRTVDPFNDATTSYFHRSVGGYHGAKLQRYQDLIEHHLAAGNMETFNMLNTKYFIMPDQQTGQPMKIGNPDANGPAWFVDEVVLAGSADDEIAALDTLDTKLMAVADRRFAPRFMADPIADRSKLPVEKRISTTYSVGERARFGQEDTTSVRVDRIELTDYKPNHLTYKYSSAADAVAVFSEIYYDKGWMAYVDGQPAPHFRADYVLRAMKLPAGEHTVEFVFRASGFDTASNITLACSIAILAAVAAAILNNRKKKNENAG